MVRSSRGAMSVMYPLITKSSKLSAPIKVHLSMARVHPILTYAAPAWSGRTSDTNRYRLHVKQNKCLGTALNRTTLTSTRELHATAHVPQIRTKIMNIMDKFYTKAKTSSNPLIRALGDYTPESLPYEIKHNTPKHRLLERASWQPPPPLTHLKDALLTVAHLLLVTHTDARAKPTLIQDGPKVRRQTATTHGGGLGEPFEVGNPCPETHRYAPVKTFLERMNVSLATLHSSGQRARSGMRFSFVSFHNIVCLCSSVVPYWPRKEWCASGLGFYPADTNSYRWYSMDWFFLSVKNSPVQPLFISQFQANVITTFFLVKIKSYQK